MTDNIINKIKLGDIIPSDYNPRIISEINKDKLSKSINEFGLVDPIIINLNNNHIIGGHQRYDILCNLYSDDKEVNLLDLGDIGWCFVEDDFKINDDYEKALNIALNKINGDWDNSKLNEILNGLANEGFNYNLTGFENESFVWDSNLTIDDIEFDKNSSVDVYDTDNDEKECQYYITYSIVFDNEEEQTEWYGILNKLKKLFPDCMTVKDRLIKLIS